MSRDERASASRTQRTSRRVGFAAAVAIVCLVMAGACGGHEVKAKLTKNTSTDGISAAQLAEASRLVNLGASATPPPKPVVACVARVVVQNPLLDQVANDISQIPNKDLRQAVMYSYLQCGYNYVVDTYMRFAPAGLGKTQLACVRSKFTQLDVNTLAEVIVEDPDAGYTGPLVIQACKSGSKKNPLLNNGSLIGMGGS